MKTFDWRRPFRNDAGEITGSKPSPVKVRTIEPLGGNYGTDRGKRLVFTMHAGDVIGVRPERTGRELTITATDLYAHLLRLQANRSNLEKARERKAKRAERLARQRQDRAEKRLFRDVPRNPDSQYTDYVRGRCSGNGNH